jgi:predicted O-methyltransferase YrrM
MLLPTDRGLEYGSGLSTLWLARRVSQFVSVEHDAEWHDKVSGQLKKHSLSNVDHRFAPQDEPETQGDRSEYARVALEVPDSSLNFVLVDGVHRDHCARLALPKLAPGGLLIIDNVNWFLPCDSHGPASRRHEDGPAGVVWTEVYQTIRHWRTIWTTNHVWDTAIFIKPH